MFRGCVLVIDEAYGLFPGKSSSADPYKNAVINTIVEEIQNVPGEDRYELAREEKVSLLL